MWKDSAYTAASVNEILGGYQGKLQDYFGKEDNTPDGNRKRVRRQLRAAKNEKTSRPRRYKKINGIVITY